MRKLVLLQAGCRLINCTCHVQKAAMQRPLLFRLHSIVSQQILLQRDLLCWKGQSPLRQARCAQQAGQQTHSVCDHQGVFLRVKSSRYHAGK